MQRRHEKGLILNSPPPLIFLITCGLRCDVEFFHVRQIWWYQSYDYVRTWAFERLWMYPFVCIRVCFFMCVSLCHIKVHQSFIPFLGIVRNKYKNHKDQRHKHIKKKCSWVKWFSSHSSTCNKVRLPKHSRRNFWDSIFVNVAISSDA